MSLFPAYSTNQDSGTAAGDLQSAPELSTADSSWLAQSSFPSKLTGESVSYNQSLCTNAQENEQSLSVGKRTIKKKKLKRDKEKAKRKLEKIVLEKAQENLVKMLADDPRLFIDLKGSRNNLLIPTMMKKDAPYYKKPRKCYIQREISKNKKKKSRYYHFPRDYFNSDVVIRSIPLQEDDMNIITVGKTDTASAVFEKEVKFSELVGSYNQKLAEDPHNENLWLGYIDLQDGLRLYDEQNKKSNTNNRRLVAEKKLSIINKALYHNPLSEVLLRRKVDILYSCGDLDKFSEELYELLRKDFGNLYLWIRHIDVTQSTVARCTVPKVLSLYASAMNKINYAQKHGVLSTELQLIELYTRVGLFIRQCGLWEQLFMLIRLNLQLNLSNSAGETYKLQVTLPEEEISEVLFTQVF